VSLPIPCWNPGCEAGVIFRRGVWITCNMCAGTGIAGAKVLNVYTGFKVRCEPPIDDIELGRTNAKSQSAALMTR
jgi:hypothetical protein